MGMRSAGNRSGNTGGVGGERITETCSAWGGGDFKGVHPLPKTLLHTLHILLVLVSSQPFIHFATMLKIRSPINAVPRA